MWCVVLGKESKWEGFKSEECGMRMVRAWVGFLMDWFEQYMEVRVEVFRFFAFEQSDLSISLLFKCVQVDSSEFCLCCLLPIGEQFREVSFEISRFLIKQSFPDSSFSCFFSMSACSFIRCFNSDTVEF